MASSISSLGTGSGLDLQSLLTKLMAVEQQPLTKLATKEAVFQAKLSAYGSLKGALSSLQTSANNLSNASTFTANSTSQSDTTYFTSTASASAAAGNYSIEVQRLARAQTLTTAVFADTSASVGTGTLTFQFGTSSGGTFSANASKAVQTVTIDSAHNSLAGIRDAINAAGIGVNASIVNDGSGYRLLLSSNETGTSNTLKISSTGTLTGLSYDPTAGSNPISEIQSASDAVIKVNGLTVTKSSNTITDAIQGVTLSLKQAEAASTTVTSSLTVARNTDAIKSALQGFVKAYNDTESLIKSATAYDASNKTASTLTGDSTTRSIESQMRSLLSSSLSYAGGGLQRLSDVGIAFQKDGTLALDTAKLDKVLGDSTKDISSLFASVAKTGDSNISFVSSTSATKPGVYDLNLTSLGAQSTIAGNGAGGSLSIVAGVNDALALSVNGTAATVTLAAGTYTAASLAAELQSKINSDSSLKTAGAMVAVAAGSSGSVAGSVALSGLTFPYSTTAGNTAFDVTFGGSTQTVTLGSGPYASATQLQTGVQSALNSAFGSGVLTASLDASNKLVISGSSKFGVASNVSVAAAAGDTLFSNLFGSTTVTAGTELSIKSNTYGASSSLTLTSSAAVSNLFGTSLTGSSGSDVAGTLGGSAFTGLGQIITGTGNAVGLTLKVTGGSIGSRGSISFDTGFGARLSSLIDSFIGTTGLIASRTDGINRSIKDISKQTDALSARLQAIQARYTKQFTALDTAVASMQATSSYLTQQLSSLTALANYTVTKSSSSN